MLAVLRTKVTLLNASVSGAFTTVEQLCLRKPQEVTNTLLMQSVERIPEATQRLNTKSGEGHHSTQLTRTFMIRMVGQISLLSFGLAAFNNDHFLTEWTVLYATLAYLIRA